MKKYRWFKVLVLPGFFLWSSLAMYIGFIIGQFYLFSILIGLGVPALILIAAIIVRNRQKNSG